MAQAPMDPRGDVRGVRWPKKWCEGPRHGTFYRCEGALILCPETRRKGEGGPTGVGKRAVSLAGTSAAHMGHATYTRRELTRPTGSGSA
jgi:hypothetical protein